MKPNDIFLDKNKYTCYNIYESKKKKITKIRDKFKKKKNLFFTNISSDKK